MATHADGDRIDPVLDSGVPLEDISFLQRGRPAAASARLKGIAYGLVGLHLGLILYRGISNNRPTPELIGALIGGVLVVMVPLWIWGAWSESLTHRSRFKAAAWIAGILVAMDVIGFLSVRDAFRQMLPGSEPATAETFKERALRCAGAGDLPCAEESWADYLALRPNDHRALATLGIVRARRGKHAAAITDLEGAIRSGAGGYDLFAFYARSLAVEGRSAEAIDWYYSALSAAPALVDVRSELAELLVKQSRGYEALSLMQSFDAKLELAGRPSYFLARRTALEEILRKQDGDRQGEALRLVLTQGHFYAPVAVGWSRPILFMVDTGATLTSLSEKLLQDTGVRYRILDPAARMRTADGRSVPAKVVLLDRMQVGARTLRDVQAVTCEDCESLLGNSVLSRFDMQSSKVKGSEFLTLVPRR